MSVKTRSFLLRYLKSLSIAYNVFIGIVNTKRLLLVNSLQVNTVCLPISIRSQLSRVVGNDRSGLD